MVEYISVLDSLQIGVEDKFVQIGLWSDTDLLCQHFVCLCCSSDSYLLTLGDSIC